MTLCRIDSTRLSLAEYWRWRPGLAFFPRATRKLLGVREHVGLYVGRPDALVPIGPGDLPGRHRDVLDPLISRAEELGFHMHFFYSAPVVGRVTGAAAALTSGDGLSLLLLAHSEPRNALRPSRPAYSFFSCHAAGPVLATSGGLPGLVRAAPEVQVLRLRHGSLDRTWDRHGRRIGEDLARLVPFRAPEVPGAVLHLLQRNHDSNVARGVYVPLTESESDRVRRAEA